MNNEWLELPIGDLATVILGQSPPSETYNQNRNGLPFYQGKADFGAINPVTRFWCSTPSKVAKTNDILMSVRAPVGDLNIASEDCCIGRGVAAIRAINVESKYLFYQLDFHKPEISLLAQGSTFEAISGTEIRGFKIPLANENEQKKIAEILTSVDKVIELTEIEIEQLKNLKKGMMQDLLTKGIGHSKFKDSPIGKIPESWEVTQVTNVISKNIYGPRFNANDYNENGNVRTIRGTDVDSDGILNYLTAPLAKLDEKLVETHKLDNLDVVVVTTADCGVTSVFEEKKNRYIPSAYMVKLRFKNDQYNPYFFKFLMGIDLMKGQIEASIRKGTVANLPGSDLIKFKIPFPPKDEQDEIVKILQCVDRNISSKKIKLSNLKKIKKGLMQDLLTGKVKVKV
ncbi:restriction endonuclease subunit S [Peredibacter sp. HCB2-198]|uniref:restriction endonuclease subunit S n=1 Tax=Peredibacter sp. HCB2-198 TaxID=3383025 RepID=UPI0038B65FA9